MQLLRPHYHHEHYRCNRYQRHLSFTVIDKSTCIRTLKLCLQDSCIDRERHFMELWNINFLTRWIFTDHPICLFLSFLLGCFWYEIQVRWINSVEPNSMTPSAMCIQDMVRSPCLWPWRGRYSTTSLPGSPPRPARWGSNSWKLDVGHCQRLSCRATIPWAGRTRRPCL